MVTKVAIAEGVLLLREYFSAPEQQSLLEAVQQRLAQAPLYRPVMPGNGKPFSVQECSFGPLGWVSDKAGYRYQPLHPVTGQPWPDIPDALLALWEQINGQPAPESCLVNFYGPDAKMGLHQDRDEKDTSAAVVGVSLGDSALFRIGSPVRGGKTRSVTLASGDVIVFGGPARLAYHGIDRVRTGTSRLLAGGGRLSLTLRRVRA